MGDLDKKLSRGDSNAWRSLYGDISPGLYRFLLARVGNSETAQDIMQEGFSRLARNLSRIKNSNSYKAWLYSTCYHLAIDWHRKQHSESADRHLQYLGTPTTADPLTEIIQREDNKVVRRTVLALWRWTVFTAFANIVGVGVYSIMRQRIGDC